MIKLLLVIILPLIFVQCNGNKLQDEQKLKPNILIILADDLGYGDISFYAQTSYRTPNIDKIGQEGVVATHFYVPTPYCAPSRASLLTGRFPLRHGLIKNPTPDAHIAVDTIGLNPNEITLAEVLKDNGYATKAIGKWHLGHYSKFLPVEQGFNEYYGILYSNDMRPVQIIQNRDTVQYPVNQRFLTKDYTEKAIDFIQRKKDEPFFLYLSHAMPHKPLAVSDAFYTPDSPDDLYADVIKELDWGIGEVLKTLENLNILDETIIIFMSDNGPWYGGSTGGLKGMKATTWEGGIRVPFMIRYPKVFSESLKLEKPISSLDILPTLLSLCNISNSNLKKLDGIDITSTLQNRDYNHPPIFTMHDDKVMSIRAGDYKLFVNRPPGFEAKNFHNWVDPRGPDGITIIAQTEQATPKDYPGIIPYTPKDSLQLFNIVKDPTESENLAKSHPEIVKELLKEYKIFKDNLNE